MTRYAMINAKGECLVQLAKRQWTYCPAVQLKMLKPRSLSVVALLIDSSFPYFPWDKTFWNLFI